MSTVMFRPPLWSQEGSYPAADDRSLIAAIFQPGVVGLDDLRVRPRAEGANLSVDVAPGTIIVEGTEQANQGSYLCRLTERINLPIAAGPAAGNARTDLIIARVYEPVSAAAYWRAEVFSSSVGPAGQDPVFGPLPPSSEVIARVGPVTQAVSQIVAGLITDMRAKAGGGRIGGAGRVTSLPASPSDGMEVTYTAGNGVLWRLRYDAASRYWECVGGTPLTVSAIPGVNTSTPTDAGWVDVPSTPTITLPFAGDWMIGGGGTIQQGLNQGTRYQTSLAVVHPRTVGTVYDTSLLLIYAAGAAPTGISGTAIITHRFNGSNVRRFNDMLAGDVLRMRVQAYRNHNPGVYHRHISALPVRIK